MTQYLIPTDAATVEKVAKAIAKDRMHRGAMAGLEMMSGVPPTELSQALEYAIDTIFEDLWNSEGPVDVKEKENYRKDARAAVNAINLSLLVSPPDKV